METLSHQAPVDFEPSLQAISDALRGLKFGSVTAIVQDGVIVQVERLEKNRLLRRNSRSDDSAA
jgi:hypothetical protein